MTLLGHKTAACGKEHHQNCVRSFISITLCRYHQTGQDFFFLPMYSLQTYFFCVFSDRFLNARVLIELIHMI